MRANLILILLIVLANPVYNAESQILGRRRSQRQERRMPSQNYSQSSPCPGGVCPVPQSQTVPSQSGGSIMGYQNLTPPTFEPRPKAPAPMALTQTQPAQAVADSPPQPPATSAPAAAKEFSAAKFTELLSELEKLTGLTAQPTTPVVAPTTPVVSEPPPVPPQPEPSPSPQSQASEVVNSLGVIEVVHRDGNGNTVQSATINLSDYVRKEIGAKE